MPTQKEIQEAGRQPTADEAAQISQAVEETSRNVAALDVEASRIRDARGQISESIGALVAELVALYPEHKQMIAEHLEGQRVALMSDLLRSHHSTRHAPVK